MVNYVLIMMISGGTGRTARKGKTGVVSCLVQSQADLNVYGKYQGHHALLDAKPLAFPTRAEAAGE